MSKEEPKIAIIGAGASGIAAATKLVESGFNAVTVLEAENRVGGRLHSVNFEGTVIDLGAQWVHGEEDNIVYQMVKDLDLLSESKTSKYKNLSFFTSDNAKINTNLTNRLYEIGLDIFQDEKSAKEHDETFGEYFAEAYFEKVLSEFGENKEILKLAKMMEEWLSKFILCFDPAESWHQMSAKSLGSFVPCKGDQLLHWKNRGYATILDVLMRKIPNKSKDLHLENNIILNKEVNSIIWDQNSNSSKKVTLKCTDGSTYDVDHVILTMSVGVLKSIHEKFFTPKLPEYKVNCIDNIPLGTCDKILLKFPEKWWPDEIKDISFLWTEKDKKMLVDEFPHGPVHNGRSWLEDVFGFYTIDSHPQVLLGWVVGPMAKEIELLSDEIVQNGSMFLLQKFVGDKYSVPPLDGILRSKWGTNPHFQGSYSYVSSAMEESGAKREDFAKPLEVDDREVVLFAGEATHSKYFSSVHGAIESGYREADRLRKIYHKLP